MVDDLLELERKVPRGLRPAYHGAVFMLGLGSGWQGKLYVALILGALMLLLGVTAGLKLFVGLLGVGLVAGAVAGALHGLLRFAQRGGAHGVWLQWTASFFGFGLTALALLPNGLFTLRDPTLYPVAAGFAALGGVVMVLLDDRRPGRPLPRQYAALEGRRRLKAKARLRRAEVFGNARGIGIEDSRTA